MVHTNINDGSNKMTGSVGEGMVDMHSNPTGDSRVVSIKRAAANLIDMIEQMEVAAHGKATASQGSDLKKQACHLVAQACDMAVQAAILRDAPPKAEPASKNERETSDDHPEGAAV